MKKKTPAVMPAPISLSLPESLKNMTLHELLNSENTEFTKKKNKLLFRRVDDFGTATLEIDTNSTGRRTITQSTVPAYPKKSDYIDDIVNMSKDGMKQKDIAFQLGISPSYVNKLLKDANSSIKY